MYPRNTSNCKDAIYLVLVKWNRPMGDLLRSSGIKNAEAQHFFCTSEML
jgi:hypothetical protein